MTPNPSSPRSLVAEFRAAADGSAPDRMLVEGAKLQREALAAGLSPLVVAWRGEGDGEQQEVVELLRAAGAAVHEVSARTLERMSAVRTPQTPCALWARPVLDDVALLGRGPPLVVLACGVKDPGNLGALVRVCEAAGAGGVLALTGGADPFRPKAVRAAAGSVFRHPVRGPVASASALELVRAHGLVCLAADGAGGTPYLDVDWRQPIALALGGEGPGLPPEIAAAARARVHVPMAGAVESLNVAVAAGVLLYEARRQRGSVRG